MRINFNKYKVYSAICVLMLSSITSCWLKKDNSKTPQPCSSAMLKDYSYIKEKLVNIEMLGQVAIGQKNVFSQLMLLDRSCQKFFKNHGDQTCFVENINRSEIFSTTDLRGPCERANQVINQQPTTKVEDVKTQH